MHVTVRMLPHVWNLRSARGMAVVEDRHHVHVLRTPAEVRRAVEYVTGNFESHARRRGEPVADGFRDRFGSRERPELVGQGETWLLRGVALSGRAGPG